MGLKKFNKCKIRKKKIMTCENSIDYKINYNRVIQ